MSLVLFVAFDDDDQPASPGLTLTTTPAAIRDRIIELIETYVSTRSSGDRFLAYRDEGGADFQAWAEANAEGCRRRFQVRDVSRTNIPEVSGGDIEETKCTFRVMVAYPQTSRDGSKAARDRDDTFDADARAIVKLIGMNGRANFVAPYPDCCWRTEGNGEDSRVDPRLEGKGVDFLVIWVSYSFLLDVR